MCFVSTGGMPIAAVKEPSNKHDNLKLPSSPEHRDPVKTLPVLPATNACKPLLTATRVELGNPPVTV